MKKEQEQIREFMVKAGQDTPAKPVMPNADVRKLRVKLIAEELCELAESFGFDIEILNGEVNVFSNGATTNLTESYDAILDLLVVTIGAGVAIGTDLEPGWQEVHRSNMSKFIDGHRREDGKWVKGPSYSPAQLAPIIEAQLK